MSVRAASLGQGQGLLGNDCEVHDIHAAALPGLSKEEVGLQTAALAASHTQVLYGVLIGIFGLGTNFTG